MAMLNSIPASLIGMLNSMSDSTMGMLINSIPFVIMDMGSSTVDDGMGDDELGFDNSSVEFTVGKEVVELPVIELAAGVALPVVTAAVFCETITVSCESTSLSTIQTFLPAS